MDITWKIIQKHVGVKADGIPGAKTAQAIAKHLNIATHLMCPTQAQVRANTSIFGEPGSNLVTITLPYPMRLSWDQDTVVTKMTCHEAVADAVRKIFTDTLDTYGFDRIKELGLDLYGGCYNDRSIVGGKSKSMHSWGIAIDVDPDGNGLKTHRPEARFSAREYEPFWEIVENQGAISLGRERDYDWMHFQFALL